VGYDGAELLVVVGYDGLEVEVGADGVEEDETWV